MPSPSSTRSLQARRNALISWAYTQDRSARTQAARTAFLDRFEQKVDPEGLLAPAERARRAEALKRSHFADLALKSAESRRKRAER